MEEKKSRDEEEIPKRKGTIRKGYVYQIAIWNFLPCPTQDSPEERRSKTQQGWALPATFELHGSDSIKWMQHKIPNHTSSTPHASPTQRTYHQRQTLLLASNKVREGRCCSSSWCDSSTINSDAIPVDLKNGWKRGIGIPITFYLFQLFVARTLRNPGVSCPGTITRVQGKNNNPLSKLGCWETQREVVNGEQRCSLRDTRFPRKKRGEEGKKERGEV